jgi:hypothetical protein
MQAPQLGWCIEGHAELRQEGDGPGSSELVVCLSEGRERQREELCGVLVPVWLAKEHEQEERRRCSEPSD